MSHYKKTIITNSVNARLLCVIVFILCSLCITAQNKNKEKHTNLVVITDEMKKNSRTENPEPVIQPTRIKRDNNTTMVNTGVVLSPTHAAPSKLNPVILTKEDSIHIEEIKRIKGREKLHNTTGKE